MGAPGLEQCPLWHNPVSLCHLSGEITCLEGLTVVYRSSVDLFFYVVGGCQENEVGVGGSPTDTPMDTPTDTPFSRS